MLGRESRCRVLGSCTTRPLLDHRIHRLANVVVGFARCGRCFARDLFHERVRDGFFSFDDPRFAPEVVPTVDVALGPLALGVVVNDMMLVVAVGVAPPSNALAAVEAAVVPPLDFDALAHDLEWVVIRRRLELVLRHLLLWCYWSFFWCKAGP